MPFDICVDTSTVDVRVPGVTARVSGPDDLLAALRRVVPISPPWLNAVLHNTVIEYDVEIDEYT